MNSITTETRKSMVIKIAGIWPQVIHRDDKSESIILEFSLAAIDMAKKIEDVRFTSNKPILYYDIPLTREDHLKDVVNMAKKMENVLFTSYNLVYHDLLTQDDCLKEIVDKFSIEDKESAMTNRLRVLRHGSWCQRNAETCHTPFCAAAKRLWNHISNCDNNTCTTRHCVTSRVVFDHYNMCNKKSCQVCAPVRATNKRYKDRQNEASRDIIAQTLLTLNTHNTRSKKRVREEEE